MSVEIRLFFFFSSRRRHTRFDCDWSSDCALPIWAQEIAATLVPQSTRGFLEGGAASHEAVASITEWVTVPASSARFHAPIADPGKFICIEIGRASCRERV